MADKKFEVLTGLSVEAAHAFSRLATAVEGVSDVCRGAEVTALVEQGGIQILFTSTGMTFSREIPA